MFSFKIQMYECKHSIFTFWIVFFNHGVFRWWRIVTAIFRACWCLKGKIYAPQNGQVTVKKWEKVNKMRKSFKTLSELKLKFIHKGWEREAMAHKTLLAHLNNNIGCVLFMSTFTGFRGIYWYIVYKTISLFFLVLSFFSLLNWSIDGHLS